MSILFYDPEATRKISPTNIVSTIVLSGFDLTFFIYGARFIKKAGMDRDDEKQTEETTDHEHPA